jgi:hypothetical protein
MIKRQFDKFLIATILVAILFIIFTIPHLFLPCYWDETCPFSVAIYHLYNNGISMMPNSIPSEFSRGHPLLFHFLDASWMNLFGGTLVAAKTFPLLLSVILIFTIFFFGREFFSSEVGFISALLFTLQSVFLGQASFLLLEVQLALFTIATVYAFLKEKPIFYIIFGTLLLLTKETGLTVIVSIGLWQIIKSIMVRKELPVIKNISNIIISGIPIALTAIYFIIQKIQNGWFFFPIHVGFISFKETDIISKIITVLNYVFLRQGRIYLSLLFIVSFIMLIVSKKQWLTKKQKELLIIIGIYLFVFIAFCSVNFLSNRYILCAIPPVIIIFSGIIFEGLKEKKQILIVCIGILSLSFVYHDYNYAIRSDGDDNLGFINEVKVHQEVVKYCEVNNLYDSTIYTHFLMWSNLIYPSAGYLSDKNHIFTKIAYKMDDNVKYCIFSNIEYEPAFDNAKKDYKLKLIKRFEKNKAWCEIYRVIGPVKEKPLLNDYEKRIQYFISCIRADGKWLNSVEEKAKQRQITLDSMIRLDAIYMVEQELAKK